MPKILHNHHVLAVHDLEVSARFYERALGFREVMRPDGWRFMMRDGCMLMLGECRDAVPARDLGDHSYVAYLLVDDVDAFWRALPDGADVTARLADRPWGMREFGVRSPDGHRIMVGQDLDRPASVSDGG